MKERKCFTCKETKTLDKFNKDKNDPLGRQRECRDCSKARYFRGYKVESREIPNLPGEQWRDIPGWEGVYVISNRGRCKRIANASDGKRLPNRLLNAKPSGWNGEYLAFVLTWNGESTQVYAHRAVLLAFVGEPPDETYQTNHRDGNKQNNDVRNLEWVTPTENQQHKYVVLEQSQNGEQNPNNTYTREEIIRVLNMYKSGKYSQRDIARKTGIDYRYVNAIVHRKAWAHLD